MSQTTLKGGYSNMGVIGKVKIKNPVNGGKHKVVDPVKGGASYKSAKVAQARTYSKTGLKQPKSPLK